MGFIITSSNTTGVRRFLSNLLHDLCVKGVIPLIQVHDSQIVSDEEKKGKEFLFTVVTPKRVRSIFLAPINLQTYWCQAQSIEDAQLWTENIRKCAVRAPWLGVVIPIFYF